jgi:hypothetical protein
MSTEPNLQDMEKVYRITVEQAERIKTLEAQVKQLETRIPSSGLLSKHILVRIVTVGAYVFVINSIWASAISIISQQKTGGLPFPIWSDTYTGAILCASFAVLIIVVMIFLNKIERNG